MARRGDDNVRQQPVPRGGPRAMGADCDNCPLNGKRPVFGDGPKDFTWAIVGEAPGRNESDRGIPFIGQSGELLELLLQHIGTSRASVFIDNAVACMPPDGDMKNFLRAAKKDLGDAYRSPVDCCRPRLFNALKVPRCAACRKWLHGPEALRCACKTPIIPTNATKPPVVLYVGNFAMEALHGHQGISEKRGYVDWAGLRKHRPVPGQEPNGKRLPAKQWLEKYACSTPTPAVQPAPSSAAAPTSKSAKARSRVASASGSKSRGGTTDSSSSQQRTRGKKR